MVESKEETIIEMYQYQGHGKFVPTIDMKEYLYNIVRECGPLTRPEIKEITGIPRTTLYDALIRLILAEKVEKFSEPRKDRGRPKIIYQIVEREK